ncbi:tryptophan halogenase [Sphingomonas spermidinifaciens]|uniref:Tryptophan halogenase n=1 Tax=Sphingomonas spermidinifaciens TaxID=1141889 RepID=A0A2A4B6G5_9SPHN|nr:tryptophan halogenase family protein [Sphingomonas spermidinifaciens]PCD03657.1 tryptophan halogenase [Sphingomonas spermidinifaciens]
MATEERAATSSENAVRKVVIAGGGTAGWMTAAALAADLADAGLEIELVESPEIGTIGVGEATVPFIHTFNRMLGLDQADFMRRCNATFKLGIEFVGWRDVGESYFHSFAQFGPNFKDVSFYHMYLRYAALMAAKGADVPIEASNVGAVAARHSRFRHPHTVEKSGLPPHHYAFHFDAALYADYLRTYATARGVRHISGRIVEVAQVPETGFIKSLRLEDGRVLAGDLFVDCTGLAGLLIEKTLGSGYEEWKHWLPCDRAVAVPCAKAASPIPYTQASAEASGWRWRIPLQHRTGNGMVYSGAFADSDDAVEARLMEAIDGEPLAAPRRIRFTPGRRREVWVKNCVSVGLASGFLEPLESTNIHLVQSIAFKLLSYFPDRHFDQREIDAFNAEMQLEIEHIRDFIILHYKVTEREDTPFWAYCKHMSVPDSLQARIDMFRPHGRLFVKPGEFFTYNSWLSVMHGQGLRADRLVRQIDRLTDEEVIAYFEAFNGRVASVVASMPAHDAYLQAFVSARDTVTALRGAAGR